MDYAYIFRMLLKRKWIIIGTGILAGLIALLFTLNQERKYRSAAQISTGFAISDEIKLLTAANLNVDNDADTKFNNVIVTFTSPAVITLLSYRLILHDLKDPKPFRVLDEKDKKSEIYQAVNLETAKSIFESRLMSMKMLTSYNPDEKKLLELLTLYKYDYKTLTKELSIYRLERTDYIQIEYTSENPELSAFIVNTSYQEFMRYYQTVRSNKSQESIDTLQSLLEKKKQESDAKYALLRGGGLVDGDIASTSNLELISSLETALSEAKAKQTSLNYDLQKVNQRIANTGKPKQNDNTVNNNNGEIIALRKAMEDAYQAYIDGGSNDASLKSKYDNLKAQYQEKAASSRTSTTATGTAGLSKADLLDQKNDIELDIRASDDNIASLQDKINALKGNLVNDAARSSVAKSLMKDAELANKEYLDAKQKYNEAMDITNSSVNNFRQVLIGQPAIEPEPSKRLLTIAMSGAAAFMISMLIVILLTYMDASIKTPGIFSKMINLRLISMINFMDLKSKSLPDIIGSKDISHDNEDKARHNVFRESLRKLRYEIERSGKKIFLFTSTQKGQGKTTLVQALSFSLSLSKKKILIIDTNFCNNDLTVQLNAKPVLEKIDPVHNAGKSLIDKIRNVAQNAGVPGVFVIGSEGGDYTPSEILPRENLLHHLHELTAEYDYIFLEGPPLNDFSDAKELSQYVDGVIAIFSATQVIKQIDKESMKFYKELGNKFYGAVLNKVDLENVNVS